MSDDDIALSEKRVYGERREATRAYVAGGMGVAYLDASDDQIGRFGLERRCSARDVAGGGGRLLVATDEDVLVGTGEDFADAGFGPAVAVGVGRDLLAAGPDGRVARLTGEGWETLGEIADVRAVDGDLIAAADGVYRVEYGDERSNPRDGAGPALSHVGLDDARDVDSDGALAATGTGLYRREDGWNREREGESTVVASAGERASGDRAHAAVDGTLFERVEGEWLETDAPAGEVVDVAYDRGTFAVTGDGRVLLDPATAKDGTPEWRTRSLGLADVVGIAIP